MYSCRSHTNQPSPPVSFLMFSIHHTNRVTALTRLPPSLSPPLPSPLIRLGPACLLVVVLVPRRVILKPLLQRWSPSPATDLGSARLSRYVMPIDRLSLGEDPITAYMPRPLLPSPCNLDLSFLCIMLPAIHHSALLICAGGLSR